MKFLMTPAADSTAVMVSRRATSPRQVHLGNRAVSLIRKTGAENIVADCGSCRMQLGGLSGMTGSRSSGILCDHWDLPDQKKSRI